MDERTWGRLEDLALHVAQAGVAVYDEALEAMEQVWNEFCGEAAEALEALWEELECLSDEIALDQVRFRKKWRLVRAIKLPVLYLDKRRKVHRCRNNC